MEKQSTSLEYSLQKVGNANKEVLFHLYNNSQVFKNISCPKL